MKRAMQTGFLLVCGYLGMWLLVCFLLAGMIYGTAANTPDWVFWVGLALAVPLYLVLCGPKEVLDSIENFEYYKDNYVLYRDKYFDARDGLHREVGLTCSQRAEIKELKAEIKELESELEEAKACKCRKVTVCVRRCGK